MENLCIESNIILVWLTIKASVNDYLNCLCARAPLTYFCMIGNRSRSKLNSGGEICDARIFTKILIVVSKCLYTSPLNKNVSYNIMLITQ